MSNEKPTLYNGSKSVISRYFSNALSILAIIVSSYGTYYTTVSADKLQLRQSQGEVIKNFDLSSNQIIDTGGKFLTDLSEEKDLSESKRLVSNFAGKQVLDIEALNRTFMPDELVISYRNAVGDFNKTAQSIRSAKDMKLLIESFGQVVDTRNNLINKLHYRNGSTQRS